MSPTVTGALYPLQMAFKGNLWASLNLREIPCSVALKWGGEHTARVADAVLLPSPTPSSDYSIF